MFDPIPSALKSDVVYEFSCAECNALYIGETTRHLSTMMREHTTFDKTSQISKRLHSSPHCKSNYKEPCFIRILDTAHSPFSKTQRSASH